MSTTQHTMSKMRQRLDALAGDRVPPSQVAAADALAVLRSVSVELAGGTTARDQCFFRVAIGRATAADDALLAGLPADALKAAGMKTPTAYATLMSDVLKAY